MSFCIVCKKTIVSTLFLTVQLYQEKAWGAAVGRRDKHGMMVISIFQIRKQIRFSLTLLHNRSILEDNTGKKKKKKKEKTRNEIQIS